MESCEPKPRTTPTNTQTCATLGAAPYRDAHTHHVTMMSWEQECRSLSSVAPLFSFTPAARASTLNPLPLPSTRPYDTPSIIISSESFSPYSLRSLSARKKNKQTKKNPKKPIHQTYCLFHF